MFTDISFEGQQMVVELVEDHNVEKLNLIGPEGAQFTTSEVSTGESKVPLQILQISPGEPEHYPIGESKLVAVSDDSNHSKIVKLVPELEITDVTHFSKEESDPTGNLEVTVANDGSGPTWIYDVFHEDSPNLFANRTAQRQGTPTGYLKRPNEKLDTVIEPGTNQKFVGQYPPFVFDSKEACNSGSFTATSIAKTGANKTVKAKVEGQFSGKSFRVDATGRGDHYTCGKSAFIIQEDTES